MKRIDDRNLFHSDEEFANFRGLIVSNQRSEYLFRSASAGTNRYGRAETVNKLMRQYDIRTIIDLSGINYRCKSAEFGYALVQVFSRAIHQNGPYIIQCDAGKKRTGFACIILEALSGTSLDLIIDDYLESYVNNNGLDLADVAVTWQPYERVKSLLQFITNSSDPSGLAKSAKEYLVKYGMANSEIESLKKAFFNFIISFF